MAQFFCPKCWMGVAEAIAMCPHCGVEIESFWNRGDFVDKLILALQHSEPQTPMRAAWLLGQLGDHRAVGPLVELVRSTPDVFLAREAVEALGRIGSEEALVVLHTLADHPTRMVAEEATAALGRLGPRLGSDGKRVAMESSDESIDQIHSGARNSRLAGESDDSCESEAGQRN